jgi:hypothetical protein
MLLQSDSFTILYTLTYLRAGRTAPTVEKFTTLEAAESAYRQALRIWHDIVEIRLEDSL